MSGEDPDRKGKGRRRQRQTPRMQPDREHLDAVEAAAEAAAEMERRRRASRPASAGPSTSTAAPRRAPSPQHPSTSTAPSSSTPYFRRLAEHNARLVPRRGPPVPNPYENETAEDIFRRVAMRRELARMFGTPPRAPAGPMARGDGGPGFRRATSVPPGKLPGLADPQLQRSPLRLPSSLDRPRNTSRRRNQRDDIETRHSTANTPPDRGEDVDDDTPSGDDPFGLRFRRPPSPP